MMRNHCKTHQHTSSRIFSKEDFFNVDAHFVPDDLEIVCESCLVPSLPSKIKEINAGGYFCMSAANDVDTHFLSDDLERVCASMQQKKTIMISFCANLFPVR
jgi:hypothetical protein